MIPFHFQSRPEPHPGVHAIEVPANLNDKTDLLAFLARAIPLPDYFGHNWDSLEECLADLPAASPAKIILIHLDLPLANAPADQRLYLQVLASAARSTTRLSVIFPETCHPHISALLE